MRKRRRYSIIYWPWYLRWTLGVVLVVGLVTPIGVCCVLWSAIRAGFSELLESEVWRMMASCAGAVVFGDRDK